MRYINQEPGNWRKNRGNVEARGRLDGIIYYPAEELRKHPCTQKSRARMITLCGEWSQDLDNIESGKASSIFISEILSWNSGNATGPSELEK